SREVQDARLDQVRARSRTQGVARDDDRARAPLTDTPPLTMSISEPPTDLDTLRFYRDEITHEFNLLAMRSTMLITCQSFLIVPFAILHTATSFRWATAPLAMVAILGFSVAFWLRQPLGA